MKKFKEEIRMNLFDGLKIKDVELKNRIVMPPMCMYASDEQGFVQPFHTTHYTTRAYGGVGLIIIEATAVEPRGRISGNDLGIWNEDHVYGLKKLVDCVHLAGAKIAIQLGHAGRKCGMLSEIPIAPSAIAYSNQYQEPQEMSIEDIYNVLNAFQEAARRAKRAGFDFVEIHGAHGYLINQFLSPLTNKRQDGYGITLEGRTRFLQEVVFAVRKEWDKGLFVRLSAEEYAPEGHHIEQTLEVVKRLKNHVDVIDVSSGGVVPVSMKPVPKYQIPYAKQIKKSGYLVIGGGLITKLDEVNDILNRNDADLVYLGRELLRNPYFALFAAKEMRRNDLILKAYERGIIS